MRPGKNGKRKDREGFEPRSCMNSFTTHKNLLIEQSFLDLLKKNGLADFDSLMRYYGGYILKEKRSRSITRLDMDGKSFYLKRHAIPLRERLISLVPWIRKEDALNEWQNILLLKQHGFQTITPVAFGERKKFGVLLSSLTLTESLCHAEKLETFMPRNFSPPLGRDGFMRKREIIRGISLLAKKFHAKGFNHQDFYLGHLFIRPSDGEIFILDLQRMHFNKSISRHDMIKDLAQICYSAQSMNIFTRTDLMRFIHSYLEKDKLADYDKKLIRKILTKVKAIARHDANIKKRRTS